MKILILFLFLITIGVHGKCQQKAYLPFCKMEIELPNNTMPVSLKVMDTLYRATIFSIGGSKYFYIKQSYNDSLTVEAGQVGLYKISNNYYLLREGMWTLESSSKKVLFHNFGKKGLMEEVQIHLEPFQYEKNDKRIRKKNKTIKHDS